MDPKYNLDSPQYRSMGIIENTNGNYMIVKRKGKDIFSFVGGKESGSDHGNPLTTFLRENEEETDISPEKITEPKLVYQFSYMEKEYFVFYSKMKNPEKLPGYISHDQDIECYYWMNLDQIMEKNNSGSLTPVDVDILCWLKNNQSQLRI